MLNGGVTSRARVCVAPRRPPSESRLPRPPHRRKASAPYADVEFVDLGKEGLDVVLVPDVVEHHELDAWAARGPMAKDRLAIARIALRGLSGCSDPGTAAGELAARVLLAET